MVQRFFDALRNRPVGCNLHPNGSDTRPPRHGISRDIFIGTAADASFFGASSPVLLARS